MAGLREYLIEKAAAIRALARTRPDAADWRETVSATCVADDRTGVRKLRIRDWQFIGDSGPGFGGFSLGPSSPELLCGVISTCLTHTYEIGACLMGLPLERIEVRVTAENNDARFGGLETKDPATPFNLQAVVKLDAPGVARDKLDELHAYASRSCPLTNLIRGGAPVSVAVAT
jgi:organic hydroperoxide reductase OsmC/OhrA